MPLAVKNINFNYECGAAASTGVNWCICESVGRGPKGFGPYTAGAPVWPSQNAPLFTTNYYSCGYTPSLGSRCTCVSHSSLGPFGVSSILYCVPSGRTAKVIPLVHNVQFINGVYVDIKYCTNWFSASMAGNACVGGWFCVESGKMFCSSMTTNPGRQCTSHLAIAQTPSAYNNTGHFCLTVGDPTVLAPYNAVCGSFSAPVCTIASASAPGKTNCSQNVIGINSWFSSAAQGRNGAAVIADYGGITTETGAYGPALNNYIDTSVFSSYVSKEPLKENELQPYFYLQAGDCIAINFCTQMCMCAGALTACTAATICNIECIDTGGEFMGWCNAETNLVALAGHYAKVQLNYIIIEEASS